MQIQALHSPEEFQRYVDFAAEVYQGNPCWIAPDPHHLLALLGGKTPQAEHCRIQPFWAEVEGRIAATVTAVVDDAFNRHWNERAGNLFFFEALPEADAAAVALLNSACEWLAGMGCGFARLAFLFGWQVPLTIDAYDCSPTFFHTYNPPYYHRKIKNARFGAEKGLVEYRVCFDDHLAAMYREMAGQADRAGVRLRSWDFSRLEEEAGTFRSLYNRTFAGHWGAPQFTLAEVLDLTVGLKEFLAPEFTVFAEAGDQVAGVVFSLPDLNQSLRGQPIDHGILLAIGVDETYRGKGVNLAMAARSYLAMIEQGYRSASYTVVLDDNWPSRRTAEKLGARAARNFVVYRRNLI